MKGIIIKAKAVAHSKINFETDPKVMLQRERHVVKLRQNYRIIELFRLFLQSTNLNFCQQNTIFVQSNQYMLINHSYKSRYDPIVHSIADISTIFVVTALFI
jgi:hypothetical protein